MISKHDLSSSFLTIKDKISNLHDIDLSTKPLLVIIGSNKCGKTTLNKALFDVFFEKDERNELKSPSFQWNQISLLQVTREENDIFQKNIQW